MALVITFLPIPPIPANPPILLIAVTALCVAGSAPIFVGSVCSAGGSGMVLPAAEKLNNIRYDLQLRAILTTLFVLPCLELEPPFNEDAAALLKILRGVLRIAAPEGDIHEGHFLLLLPALILPHSIQGEAQFGDGVSGFSFPELGIASQIADKGNTIVTAHERSKLQKVHLNKCFFELFSFYLLHADFEEFADPDPFAFLFPRESELCRISAFALTP